MNQLQNLSLSRSYSHFHFCRSISLSHSPRKLDIQFTTMAQPPPPPPPSSTCSSSSSSHGVPHNHNQCQFESTSAPSPELEHCLKLLRGGTDSQRLAGLLLVTKVCNKDDYHSLTEVYNAIGSRFLHRLLLTGMRKGSDGGDSVNANRDAYLQLAVTVMAVFCRVPKIAATEDMISNIPLVLDVMSNELSSSYIEECFEILFLVTTANDKGALMLYSSGAMTILASQMPTLPDGSRAMELAMKVIHVIISKLPGEKIFTEYPLELSKMVVVLTKQFAFLHNSLKFEALHLLCAIMASNFSGLLLAALRATASIDWSDNMRIGVVAILQNRVGPSDKLEALILAERVISIVGEGWMIGEMNFPDVEDTCPADRCILLILESSRVEIAVLLNEMAYLKFEAPKNTSSAETFLLKLRNLGVAFSLVEKVIKLISKFGGDEEVGSNSVISESTFTKVISGLNETIGVVLDYLQDAKEHAQNKGDDLLASVRIVGSYLAETPHACKDKVKALLGYMLSVEGGDEPSPFYSTCFLLPMLCQITMKIDGCKLFASSGAFQAVVFCLISLIDASSSKIEDDGTILLACDTVLNFLVKREQVHVPLDDPCFVLLMRALTHWTEDAGDPTVIMMAASICALILESTSEEALLRHPDFDVVNLISVAHLIKRSLSLCDQDMISDDDKTEADLHQIVNSGYSSWADRFPGIRQVVEG